jgi:thioredoxin-like negative regulator of GroEL
LWRGSPSWLPVALAVLPVAMLGQRTWQRLPDWQTTTTLFERDVAGDPHYREGGYQLAAALHMAGRDTEAKTYVDAVIAQRTERDRFASEVFQPGVLELACRINDRLERPEDTIRLVEVDLVGTSVEMQPGLYFCYAAALEPLGRCRESLEIYHQLAASDPDHPAFIVSIARCHARLGDASEARAWLDRIDRQRVQDRAVEAAIIEVRAMLRGEGQKSRARRRRR